MVYEKDISSQCITIYITLSNKEVVDQDLQKIELRNGKHIRYISFWNTPSEIKICSIHINNINNMPVKYELRDNASILDEVRYQNKTGILRDILLEIKYNKSLLFVRVEQGSGRREQSILILMIPKLRAEV